MTPLPMGEEPVVIVQTARGPVDVDASLAPIVAALNAAGVETVASCSGHGHRPGNIALRDGREIIIARNFEEARRIDALFPVGANGEPTPVVPVGPVLTLGGSSFCVHRYYINKDGTTNCPSCRQGAA